MITQLLKRQEEELKLSIQRFRKWLQATLNVDTSHKYEIITFVAADAGDWIMKADEMMREARFNPYVTKMCSLEYFEAVVLHECVHLLVQNVPNKSDAKRVKDGYGNPMMKQLDIAADYWVARYYKEDRAAGLGKIFAVLYYEASRVFGDPRVRDEKFERFMGSILSIANLFLQNPGNRNDDGPELYQPTLINFDPAEQTLDVLIERGLYSEMGSLKVSYQDVMDIRHCYTSATEYTVAAYVDRLVKFAVKALPGKSSAVAANCVAPTDHYLL
jgi:hypothetical protein